MRSPCFFPLTFSFPAQGRFPTIRRMSRYLWRNLTHDQRMELLEWRKNRKAPWHSPPHPASDGHHRFHITAACFDHQPLVGRNPARMESFSQDLLAEAHRACSRIFSWCVLPNHYHLLLATEDLPSLIRLLGGLHGRSSRRWNAEDVAPGRKVFFRAADRKIRSDAHFWATMNYIHNNPVHHGYAKKWDDWPWGSAAEFLATTQPAEVRRIWSAFPVLDYGCGWDEAGL